MLAVEVAMNKPVHLVREDDYTEYFATTTNGIIYLDSQLRIRNLNREAERICSIERCKVINRRAEFVFQGYGPKFLRIFSLSEFDDLYTNNIKIKIKDQATYLHVDTLKMRDANGEISGLLVIMQDVSAVRAAIKQIQTTQMLMSLGELAAGVAHHVRTPLTTISGYLQVMLGRLENDKYTVRRDVLEVLLGEVSYINDVVKELVLFAKPPLDKKHNIQVNRVVEEALLLTFSDIGTEKIEIKKELVPDLPSISADANLLKQAIVNTMQNAMEAMPEEGKLTIKSWVNSDLHMIVIAIIDTGTGIPEEILPKIFEPFYTTKLDRMGLGLPIAHRIISEHGGFININAGENCGTSLHIYLPMLDQCSDQLRVVHQQVLNLQ